MGYLGVVIGDYAWAEEHMARALAISQRADYAMREGATLVYIGYGQRNRGDNAAALASQEAALDVLSRIRFPLWGTWAHREIALVHRAMDDYDLSAHHAQEAVEMARKFGDTRQEGYALTSLGLTLEDQGCPEAANYFRQAIDCYRQMELYNRSMAPLAGLARLAANDDECEQASAFVNQILDHLASHELDKTEEGFRVYVTCYRLLDAAGDPRSAEYLAMAQEHLRIRAAGLAETEHLRMFWGMADHREIRDAILHRRR